MLILYSFLGLWYMTSAIFLRGTKLLVASSLLPFLAALCSFFHRVGLEEWSQFWKLRVSDAVGPFHPGMTTMTTGRWTSSWSGTSRSISRQWPATQRRPPGGCTGSSGGTSATRRRYGGRGTGQARPVERARGWPNEVPSLSLHCQVEYLSIWYWV